METISKSLLKYLLSKHTRKIKKDCSSLRFIYKLKILKNYFQALNATLARRTSVLQSPVDVLVVHRIELNNKVGQKKSLLDKLRSEGLVVEEINTPKIRDARSAQIHKSRSEEAFLFRYHDLYCKYVVEKYRPKVILTDENGSLFSPFFKKHAEKIGSSVVHLAHSVITSESSKYDMIDYSYYVLYGESSLNYLKALKGKYGGCKVILGGGYMFENCDPIPSPRKEFAVMVLGMGPAMERNPAFFKYYKIISEWAIDHPSQQVYVRLHPRSNCNYWSDLAREYQNISVRPRPEKFNIALENVSLCITTYTNAVVDASLAGRPSLLVADEDVEDYLKIEDYFLPRAKCKEDISKKADLILNNIDHYNKIATEFSNYHVKNGYASCDSIAKVIHEIVKNKKVDADYELNGDFY